jgi:hypothetical protein
MVFFQAFGVYAGKRDDMGVLLVVLDANKDGGGPRVEIMRGLSFDDQERALHLDTYSITTHRSATYHGGVASWSVEPGFLTLNLTSEASRVLGVDGGFEIRFPRESTESVRECLAKIIDGAI